MGTVATNKKDLTLEIVYKLQKVAFADLDRSPHIKINHQLTAIKMLISLLDLIDVGRNPDDYMDADQLQEAREAGLDVGANNVRPTPTETADNDPNTGDSPKLSKKKQRHQEIREKAKKPPAAEQ